MAWAVCCALTAGLQAAEPIDFDRDIRPIFSDTCFKCHGPDANTRKADLRLDTEAGAFADREGVAPFVRGRPDQSEAYRRIISDDADELMPPPDSNLSITPAQKELIRLWIEQGAPWAQHWAFVAPKRPAPPTVKDARWVRNPIDAFVLHSLEREDLQPSPEASKETLIRRVALDLTGLPPTVQEVDAFLADASPDAYEKVIDRLLQSPGYGEHWTWPWLDAARYADSNGYQQDLTRTSWHWRDWVIEALNSNMPFDQFTIEQLAGDLLPGATIPQQVATGFNRNHMLNGEGGRIPEESRVEYVVDRVETTSTVWLGLTAGCARCHDHKYDPISQKEFYGLYAFFNNIDETGAVDAGGNANPVLRMPAPGQQERVRDLSRRVAELTMQANATDDRLVQAQADWEAKALSAGEGEGGPPAEILAIVKVPAGDRTPEQAKQITDHYRMIDPVLAAIRKQLEEVKAQLQAANQAIPATMVMRERAEPRETFLLIRGAYDKYGEKVSHGVPEAMRSDSDEKITDRLALARWLVSQENPLTARVTVNRYWQQFFGTGLVKTVEDFGLQGERPSHPELLDWLATQFVRSGWDVKALHRLIVTSATYRQSSAVTPRLLERDPANRLLARGPRHRLSAAVIRDEALAVAGLLVAKTGGEPVRPYQPPGIWEEMSFNQIKYVQDHGEKLYRRSLYTFWRRTTGPTTIFDAAGRQVCTVRQSRTNTPLHALITLNDPTFVEAARVLAQRLLANAAPGATDSQRILQAFRMATARQPGPRESQILTQSLQRLRGQYGADPSAAAQFITVGEYPRDERLDPAELAAWTGLMTLILNLDETITKE